MSCPNEPHASFEYDLEYYGGDYSGVGEFAYVPLRLVDELGPRRAFRQHTGHSPRHIIHYDLDEELNAEGDPL